MNIKTAAVAGAFALMVALAAQSAAFGQTSSPTPTNSTVTASPTPTTSSGVQGATTNSTVPNGAPSTGHGE